jgi:cytidyltransferase-like protein
MIHGRFQPFHNGHLEYLRGAAERSDEVWIGITNPDPERIKPEASDPLRHLPESNPFSYAERLLMVKAAAAELGLEPGAVHVIPFPVTAELWPAYVPEGGRRHLRLFPLADQLDRLRRRLRGRDPRPGRREGDFRRGRPGRFTRRRRLGVARTSGRSSRSARPLRLAQRKTGVSARATFRLRLRFNNCRKREGVR